MSFAAKGYLLSISQIFSRFFLFLFRVTMARVLDKAQYGVLGSSYPIIDFFLVLVSGVPRSLAREISKNRGDEKETEIVRMGFFSSLLALLLVSLPFSISIILFRKEISSLFKEPMFEKLLIPISLVAPSMCIIASIRGVLLGKDDVNALSLTWLLEHISRLVIAISLSVKFGVLGAILSFPISYIIASLPAIRRISLGKPSLDLGIRIFTYSIPITLSSFFWLLIFDTDLFSLRILGRSNEEIGEYFASIPLARIPTIVASAFSSLLVPKVARESDAIRSFSQGMRYTMFLSIPAFSLISLSPYPFLLIVGEEYFPAREYLPLICGSMLFLSVFIVLTGTLQGEGRASLPLFALIPSSLLNLFLNLATVPKFGPLGAAVSSLISSIVSLIILVKLSGIWMEHWWKFPILFIPSMILLPQEMSVLNTNPEIGIGSLIEFSLLSMAYLLLHLLVSLRLKIIEKDELDEIPMIRTVARFFP